MAVSVPTSGYAVNVMPQPALPNPQLFDVYGGFGAGMARGQQQGAQLIDIVNEARMQPLRQQQAQIQLQDALAAQDRRKLMEPLEVARYRQQLAQPVETFVGAGIEEVQRPADAFGAVPAGADIFATETVQLYDPMTQQTRQVTRRKAPLSTLEQQAQMQILNDLSAARNETRLFQIASQEEAANARNEISRLNAETARLRVDAAINDPKWRNVSTTEDANGNVVVNQMNAEGVLRQVPTNQKRSSGGTTMFGDFMFQGAAPIATQPPAAGADSALVRMKQERGGAAPFNPVAAAKAAASGVPAGAALDRQMPPQFNSWSAEQKELYNLAIQNPNSERSQRAFRALGIQ